MVSCLGKQQLYHAFRKYHRQVNFEIALKDKSKIDGAYLLLKRYKNRLKNFDFALQKMENKKAEKSEIQNMLKLIDEHKGTTIFNDMKMLMDTSMQQIEERVNMRCNQM